MPENESEEHLIAETPWSQPTHRAEGWVAFPHLFLCNWSIVLFTLPGPSLPLIERHSCLATGYITKRRSLKGNKILQVLIVRWHAKSVFSEKTHFSQFSLFSMLGKLLAGKHTTKMAVGNPGKTSFPFSLGEKVFSLHNTEKDDSQPLLSVFTYFVWVHLQIQRLVWTKCLCHTLLSFPSL